MTEGTGYRRPPAATRWKKGQSGNPKGRKKGTPNLATDLLAEMSEVIQINEGGAPRKLTKQRALLKSLAARGIKGDARAANLLLGMVIKLLGTEQANEQSADASFDDQAIIEAYLRRLQQSSEDGP